jgi:tetratricopeptide (TPR) repeat protein
VYREIIEKTLTGMAGDNDGSGSDWNRQAHKDARKLLLLFSYFHCQDIWYGLVEKGKVDPGHPDAIDNDWLSRSTQNPINFKERLKILIDRGFIALDSPVDTEEDILSARITIHERLQAFLLQNQFYDKELLRLAASCVAYSSCGDYHLREYEIRRRLMSHVDAIRQHLEEHKEYGLRAFHFDDLEPKKQVIVRQMLRDEKEELEDDFIGYVNPLAQLAYLLAWDFKTGKGLQLVENAYSSLKHLMDDCTRTRWTVLIAHLLYLDENPDTYSRALRYAQDAVDAFSRSDNNFTFRELYFAKRLEIALKSKWGSREEKVTALKDNDEVLSRVRSVLPNSVYFLDVLLDSGLILLENGLFELSHKRYSDCFESFRERLPISHRIFISLAAKVAIETVAEKDTFLKTPVTDEDKATARRLMARKAWEGFKKCLGEDDPTTITQARQLASLYDEEQDLEGCIEVRKSIVASLQRAPDSDPIDQAKELKFLAEVLWKKNSTLSEDDSDLFMEIEKSLKEAIRLIQHAKVENDEKVLALQFGMASHLCQIHRYSVALPVLQQTLSSLKSIENHSQANMNTALLQLCDVYYKLSMRGDLDDLLRIEWTEPEISSDDPSPALETLRKKVGACMDYGFAARAIPLLDKIQSYLTSLENPPQPEILENSFQIAECLEATNRIIEAEEMYNSILDSISRQPALDMQEKFLKYRVFRGLSTIYRSRGERRAAVLILDKAQEEMEGCDDKESKVVQKYVATALYDIAKLEWEIYFLEGAEPTFSASAEIRFKKVLSFQDGNGRYILEDHLIGRAFYYLGFIENFDNRTSDAEDHCLNSLVYLCKELPPILSAIDSSYHLLVRSLWETLDIPDTNKLAKLFLIMASLLARFGILDLSQTTDFSVSGLLALDWAFSKTTELGIADFALTIISELALILGVAGLALPLAHTTFLRILRTCEDLWGAENWRSQNALNLLEYIERLQYNESDNGESAYISKLGNFQRRSGDTTWDLWSDPGTSQSTNSSELLSDNKSKVLLRCGKWQLAIAQLQPELRDRLVYNPPPDTSGWPQSWTFIPKAAKMRQERIDVPLRIADAPVIIPAPKRYPTVWSSIPPKDSHAPIDPSEPLSATTIIEIFREYNFAWGFFLLLNRRLQIVVDEDFDYSAALAEKPIVFGGLRVDYVTKTLVHTSSRPTENTENNPTNSHGPNLRINSKVVSTKFKRPVLGLFGRPVETSPKKIARIGVRIRRVKGSNVGENFLTIPTHSFEKVQKPHKKSSGILSSFLRLSKRRGAGVKVFEENTRKQIGTIAKTFDVKRSYSVSGVMAPDISLIRPRNPDDILQIESPIPKLEWVSEENWSRLKGTRNQSLKILGADEIMATGIRTREAKDDCAVCNQ